MNLKHFIARAKQFGDERGNIKDEKSLKRALINRIKSVDIKAVKADVMPFLKNPQSIKIWSKDYFLELVEKLYFK